MTRRFSTSRLRRILLVLAPLTLLAAAPEVARRDECSLTEATGGTPVHTRDDDELIA